MLTERFESAFLYAHQKHAAQLRKGTLIPYIAHLMSVASLVMEHGGTENEVIAALLHDAPEDQGGRPVLDEIRTRFGDEVARIVEGCTDAWTEPKPEWWERKRQYIEHLKKTGPSVHLVSAADKLHNARAILEDYRELGNTLWPRFSTGQAGVLWYYPALIEAYREGNTPKRLVDELERVIEELKQLIGETV